MNILYICTHNRCRSILSEAITNHLSDGRIHAFSAGSQPAGGVHPLSLRYLQERGMSVEGLKSQSWDDFEDEKVDLVVTVCDSAAKETCPVWFGNTIQVHLGLPDPSKLEGEESAIRDAFFAVMDTIEERVSHLLALPLNNLTSEQLKNRLSDIVDT